MIHWGVAFAWMTSIAFPVHRSEYPALTAFEVANQPEFTAERANDPEKSGLGARNRKLKR